MPSVLWLGGGSGAGKTTVSRTLALRFDLAWYRVDGYAYEHQDRLVTAGLVETPTGNFDQRWLAPTAEELARQFSEWSTLTFPMVVHDLRGMGADVGMIVEGPQLFPALVEPYLTAPGYGLWLLPTEELQRRALSARTVSASRSTSDAARALDNQVRRNQLLDARTRAEAEALRLTVFEVDGSEDLPAMTQRAIAHFARAIATLPPARTDEQRRGLRRRENDATMRNMYACLAELGGAPAGLRVPFTCECGRQGCERVTGETPEEYERLRAAGQPIMAGST